MNARIVCYPHQHVTLKERPGEFYPTAGEADLIAAMLNPQRVAKADAVCWQPTTYNAHDAREHEAQRQRGSFPWVVLDCDDGDIDPAWLPWAIRGALGPCRPHVYSTASSCIDGNGYRSRVVVPLATAVSGDEYAATMGAIIHAVAAFTEAHGKLIKLDPCTKRAGQFFFGPNHNGTHYVALVADGPDLVLNDAIKADVAHYLEMYLKFLADREARANMPDDGKWISRVNRDLDPMQLMQDAGFEYRHSSKGRTHWHHQMQTTNSAATYLYQKDDGSYGWHTRSATLANSGLGVKDAHEETATGDLWALYRWAFAGNDNDAAIDHYNATTKYGYRPELNNSLEAGIYNATSFLRSLEKHGQFIWDQIWLHEHQQIAESLKSGIVEEPQQHVEISYTAQEGMLPYNMMVTEDEHGNTDLFGHTVAALYASQRKPNLMSATIAAIMGGTACLGGNYCGLDKDDRARGYIIATGESGCGKESAEKDGEKLIERSIAVSRLSSVPSDHVSKELRKRYAALPGSAEGLQDRLVSTPDLVISVGEIAEHLRAINTGKALHKAGSLNELVNVYSKANAYYQTRPLSGKEGMLIAAPNVSLVATSTEDKLATVLSEDFLKDGTGARFLMFSVEAYAEPLRKRQRELVLPAQLVRNIARLTNNGHSSDVDSRVEAPMQIMWDDGVAELFHQVALEGDLYPTGSLQRALLNRTPVHAKWLAMVRAALNGTHVTLHIAKWAVWLAKYSNAYKIRLTGTKLSYGEGDAASQYIMEKLRGAGTDEFGNFKWMERRSLSQLAQVRRFVDGGDRKLDDILTSLVKALAIEELVQPRKDGKGWPKRLYRINTQTDVFV